MTNVHFTSRMRRICFGGYHHLSWRALLWNCCSLQMQMLNCFLAGLILCWKRKMQYNKDVDPGIQGVFSFDMKIIQIFWICWTALNGFNLKHVLRFTRLCWLWLFIAFVHDLFSVENVCILCFCVIDLNGHEMMWLFGYKKTLDSYCPKE